MAVRVLVELTGDGPRVRDAGVPLLHADDLAALRGDGVFETLLVRGGVARELEPHLARLARSAAALDLPAPDLAAWAHLVEVLRREWRGEDDAVVRLVLSRGREGSGAPTAWATASPVSAVALRQRAAGVRAVVLERGVDAGAAGRAPWLLLGAKTLSYAVNLAALRHAERVGVDEVVLASTDGQVLEGPTSSVVLARGATLRTPPPAVGILPGTTQQALFRAAAGAGWACEVGPVSVDDLAGADGVWLVSSVRLAARVTELDGRALPGAADDELSAQVAALLA